MSKESFGDNHSIPSDGEEWLDEWEAEQKLAPQEAREMLRANFVERLEARRQNHPDEDSWIIPFDYDLGDGDDIDLVGGLWIPPDHIQDVINRVGTYIHMSAVFAMESDLYELGIKASPSLCNSKMDLSGEVPVVYVPSYMTMFSRLREQVEQDFGVVIKFG
jgi:hypothetical protein